MQQVRKTLWTMLLSVFLLSLIPLSQACDTSATSTLTDSIHSPQEAHHPHSLYSPHPPNLNIHSLGNPAHPEAINAIKWWQNSAEQRAIYRELFFMANEIIKQKIITQKLKPHTWGVIVDIDETILDNSKWNYDYDIKGSKQAWSDFAGQGISKRTPGAKELLNSIHHLGGVVNLVTNRKPNIRKMTEKNLHNEGLYFDQILYYTGTSNEWYPDKNRRFDAIVRGIKPSKFPAQNIIAWFGDSIQDFPKIYETEIVKNNGESSVYDRFGVLYFVFPNPMYGTWE